MVNKQTIIHTTINDYQTISSSLAINLLQITQNYYLVLALICAS